MSTYTAEFRDIVPDTRIVATKLVLTEHGAYLDGHETAAEREHGTCAQLESLAASLAAGNN